jgi:hypothetical protein
MDAWLGSSWFIILLAAAGCSSEPDGDPSTGAGASGGATSSASSANVGVGGAGNCGVPCGGDVRGQWSLNVLPCFSPKTEEHVAGVCEDDYFVYESGNVSGEVTFSATGEVMVHPNVTMMGTYHLVYPTVCLAPNGKSSCDDLLNALWFSCSEVGSNCECSGENQRDPGIYNGTWTTQGSTLSITSPEIFNNTIDYDYCVADGKLLLSPPVGDTIECGNHVP